MSRFSKLVSIFAFNISIISALHADSTSSLALSKEQAVQHALDNNKYLQAARQTVDQAKARRDLAGKWEDPELSIDYSNDMFFNDEGESSFGIAFEQRFPIAKRIGLQKEIADIEIALANAEIRNFERLLVREVELAINDLAHIDAQLELRQSLVKLNTKFASFVESRIETAEASELDANQVKIELYVIEQEIQKLENERDARLSDLRTLLNLEPTQDLELAEKLVHLDGSSDLGVASDTFLNSHPEYVIKKLLLEIASKETQLTLRSRWDDITVGVGFQNERSVDEPAGIGTDRFLGVSVSIPLPVRKRYEPATRERVAKQGQLKSELEATSLEFRNAAAAQKVQAQKLYQQVQLYDKNMTHLVERNLEQMNSAYGAGLANLNELFRAQEQRLKIQSAHLSMAHDYQQALVEWHAITALNISQR